MTRFFVIIEETYSKPYWSGFVSHHFKCLLWASLFLLQASLLLIFPPCGWALNRDLHVTATWFWFTFMIFTYPVSSRTSLDEYRQCPLISYQQIRSTVMQGLKFKCWNTVTWSDTKVSNKTFFVLIISSWKYFYLSQLSIWLYDFKWNTKSFLVVSWQISL